MGRVATLALAVAAAIATTASTAPAAASAEARPDPTPAAVTYVAPVDAPLAAPFRLPGTPFGPGNRGVDYATAPGTPVRAAAAGQVTFAGRIGGAHHVAVLHADGVRTSYSFLAAVAVRRGQVVDAGQEVGAAGSSLHFGARAGDAYLDPLLLLAGGGRAVVHLVPDGARTMGSEAAERRGVLDVLGAVPRAGAGVAAATVSWVAGAAVDALPPVPSPEVLAPWVPGLASMAAPPWRLARRARAWWARRATCTSASVAAAPPPGRRRVVLVAGLGSTSAHGAVDDVDTAGLGYAEGDRVRFSYRGGTTEQRPYDAADTQADIGLSGRRLRELLERMHAEDPGVPIDVIAHSQGGLVARAALGQRAPPGVASLTTLSTPHQGADLASGFALVGGGLKGALLLEALSGLGVSSIDPTSTSVGQMAETSDLIRGLNDQPLPEGVRVTSIGARADAIVPSPRAHLPGATNAVVSVPDLNDHSSLPGSDVAHREMALALAGLAPSCEGFFDFAADALTGEAIGSLEDVAGVAVAVKVR